jgi:hypothetical protein
MKNENSEFKFIIKGIFSITIITIATAVTISILTNNKNETEINHKDYTPVIDSLNNTIQKTQEKYDSILYLYEAKYNSITEYKDRIVIRYENTMENFADINVVPDDSINSYISNKLEDKQ